MTTKFYGPHLRAVTLTVGGTLATGDDQAGFLARGKWLIDGISVYLKSKGSGSGATTINVEVNDVDVFASANRPSIAYNATNAYVEKDASAMAVTTINDTEKVHLDIDAVPGTASTDLTVVLWLVPA